MFFAAPGSQGAQPSNELAWKSQSHSPRPAKRQRISSTNLDDIAAYYPKRTPKACDRCRIKKARCQWSRGKTCGKCQRDGVICTTERESKRGPKALSPEYVLLVESQRDCLLRAVSQILECGVADDPAAVGEILHEFGIGTEALGKAATQCEGDEDPPTSKATPASMASPEPPTMIDHGAFEAQSTGTVRPSTSTSIFPPTDGASLLESYFDLPYINFPRTNEFPQTSADIFDAVNSTMWTSSACGDWQIPDATGFGWLSPGLDLVVGLSG
jgi:hypothetical protein